MSVKPRVTLLMAALLAASSAFASNLGDTAKAVFGATDCDVSQVEVVVISDDMISALTSQLGISDKQAFNGARALVGLAKDSLPKCEYELLLRTFAGLDKLEGFGSLGDVNKEFDALGMDQGMTGKFASVLLDYLGKQGVNSRLLRALGSLWGVGGAG